MDALIPLIETQLENGGRANLVVTGSSMRPMLVQYRDSVTLVPVSSPVVGDILFFRRENGAYVLHRVIRKVADGFLLSGDNQYQLEHITQQAVVAKVDGFRRNGKAYTMDCFGYRLYRWVWVRLFFMRKPYIHLRRWLGHRYRRFVNGRKEHG